MHQLLSCFAGDWLFGQKTENAYIEHIINHDDGIYYIYERKIAILPEEFQSKQASRFLAAIELLSEYEVSRKKLLYVVKWLQHNKNMQIITS